MKLTFPHMGNLYIVAKALLDEFNIDYIIPPYNNKKAIEIGAKYAPEMACLPMKLNIGNFIQAYERGADTILMAGGCGPCRFGYYGEVEKNILKDIGCKMDLITLEVPDGDIKEFIRRIKKLTGGFNIYKIFKAIVRTTKVAKEVDELEKLTFKVRPREIHKGSTDKIYKSFKNKVKSIKGAGEILRLINKTKDELLNIEIDKKLKPMKIGIVGEIYTTIDSYTNFEIESKLGNMGFEVNRSVTVSQWIIEHIIKKALPMKRDLRYAEVAKPHLGAMIGGHAQETIGNTILYAKDKYDGVIQLYPLTCMPEIVAQSILPTIEEKYNIPVLTLIIDEMTGEAGYLTRIEAFTDLINKRREIKSNGKETVLYGN